MTDSTITEGPLISTAYGHLVSALQHHIQSEQAYMKQLITQEPASQEGLEKMTLKIIALYETNLFLTNIGLTFNKHLQETINLKDTQTMKQDLLNLIGDLKTLWQKEIQREIQDKTTGLLDKITQKEQAIKQAIEKRHQEIQTYAQQVTTRAQNAQTLKR